MKHKVFVSKGTATTPEQTAFVEAILDTFNVVGLDPRIMNGNEWSHEQPLKAIKQIIAGCDGLVIIAFTRTHYQIGYEIKGGQTIELQEVSLPTTWNHIEGALGYSLGLPILVIAENGLKSEGLIEQGYDWTVYWTDLSPEIGRSESFRGFVSSWKQAVKQYSTIARKKEEIDLEKLTPGRILSAMTVPQLWGTFSAIAALLIAIATICYSIGAGKFPWSN